MPEDSKQRSGGDSVENYNESFGMGDLDLNAVMRGAGASSDAGNVGRDARSGVDMSSFGQLAKDYEQVLEQMNNLGEGEVLGGDEEEDALEVQRLNNEMDRISAALDSFEKQSDSLHDKLLDLLSEASSTSENKSKKADSRIEQGGDENESKSSS